MKNIILKEITLSDWKGQSRHVAFGDNENRISGRNACGKTTLFKAFCWLLTGYSDANTPKNSDLFDNTKELTKDTPKAEVAAVISIDGTEYELKRAATAKFVRKRGTNEYEKSSSDEYAFFVDSIAFSATDFDEWISANIADTNLLRFAVAGDFFVNSVFDDKKKARKLIEQIIGEVSDAEMTGDYPIISELKEKYTIDQIDEQAANRIKSIGQTLDSIPTKINLKADEVVNLKAIDIDGMEREITALEKEQSAMDRQMFDMAERMKPALEAKHQAESAKRMKQEVYDKAKRIYRDSFVEQDNNLVVEISKAEKQIEKNRIARKEISDSITYYHHLFEEYEEKLSVLRDARDHIKNPQETTKCPYCGADLTKEKIEEKIKAALAEVVRLGKDLRERQDRVAKNIELLKKDLSEIVDPDVEPLKKQLTELRTKDIVPFSETEQGMALQADIDAVEVPEVHIPENRDLRERKDAINARLKSLYAQRGVKERIAAYEKEIVDLRTEQRKLGDEMGRYERQRIEVKQYRQEQMEILSRKVNGSLKSSSVDIWSRLKDGTMVPDLVIKNADGINYATANNASRLVTAIDIQRFFCDKLGVNLPTWVDEAAIINADNLPKLDGVQMFFLFCSNDYQLKIETK